MNDKINKVFLEREDRNLLLWVLGMMASLGSVGVYAWFMIEQLWIELNGLGRIIPIILLVVGFSTTNYFYRRSLP